MISRFEEFTKSVSQAYKYIIKIKSHEMVEYGLKASNVTCLYFLGKHADGLNAGELCELCMEDKAAVSKSLSILKEKSYVTQEDDKKYRSKYVITSKGKEVFDKIRVIIENVVEKVGDTLTDAERKIFYKALDIIVKNLGNICNEMEKN